MTDKFLIERVSQYLDKMGKYYLNEDLLEENSEIEDEENILPEKDNTPHLRHFTVNELHSDYDHEHNVQANLVGQNDYVPFGELTKTLKESVENHPENEKRLVFRAESPVGKAHGLVVPRHMWEGNAPREGAKKTPQLGMRARNEMRARVYGSEPRSPLSLPKIETMHKSALDEHFKKPIDEQIRLERESIDRLHRAGHLDSKDTTDPGEKTDTVQVETDEQGRNFVARSSKRVAGHALYTSGAGNSETHHVINVCRGQTEGCGGGVDAENIADTSKGACFAPKSEGQYVNAAVRRAAQTQAYHDPAMTNDWLLAHTHSLRQHAAAADEGRTYNPKKPDNPFSKKASTPKRFLFRPNVLDESDVSSRHVMKHLNRQRRVMGKSTIVGNSYGKTNELHDPENDYHVTFSNTGPKTKHGKKISENVQRDAVRVSETVTATNKSDVDKVNDQGNKVPPKNSYVVSNIKRGSELDNQFRNSVKAARYWTKGREQTELSDKEKGEGSEAHYDGNGQRTTPENSHYGHITLNGRRYDYQKQHVLHPRYVPVKISKKGGKTEQHLIPTDSRFKDNDFLPKERFKSRNGKAAGALLVTTPTTSTTDDQHHSNFTHDFNENHIRQAQEGDGTIDIDHPHDQETARVGGEYVSPTLAKQRIAMNKKIEKIKSEKMKAANQTMTEEFVRRRVTSILSRLERS
jgi:hypothetical protein